jgi:hypothetical protein
MDLFTLILMLGNIFIIIGVLYFIYKMIQCIRLK